VPHVPGRKSRNFPSCKTRRVPWSPPKGMVVRTATDQGCANAPQVTCWEFLLTNHPARLARSATKAAECELQDMVFRYGRRDTSRFVEEKDSPAPKKSGSELVYYDAPRFAFSASACVRVCGRRHGCESLSASGMRGANSVIIPNREDHLELRRVRHVHRTFARVWRAPTSGSTYRYKRVRGKLEYIPHNPARIAPTAAGSRLSVRQSRNHARQ